MNTTTDPSCSGTMDPDMVLGSCGVCSNPPACGPSVLEGKEAEGEGNRKLRMQPMNMGASRRETSENQLNFIPECKEHMGLGILGTNSNCH